MTAILFDAAVRRAHELRDAAIHDFWAALGHRIARVLRGGR